MTRGEGRETQDERYVRLSALHGAAIDRLARGYEADAALRQDLVQEIHVALWRSLSYFEGQCSERSWLYRVAHNVAVTHLIKRHRLKEETFAGLDEIERIAGADGQDAEAAAGQRWLVEKLLATIHRLKPTDRQVMLLYLEDLSGAEIADVTGLSAGAVAVRIHRIKSILSEPFEKAESKR